MVTNFGTELSLSRSALGDRKSVLIHFRNPNKITDNISHAEHHDSVWGLSWTAQDTVISTSADGSIRQWASATGQPYPPNAPPPKPHTLGLTSLSVSRDGRKALYNSIEGTTRLWDVGGSGEVEGTFESFAKSDDAQSGPCKYSSAFKTALDR